MDVLLGVDLVKDEEILVYGLGTLKLLASCPEVREQLTLSSQVMPLLLNVLSMCTQPAENVNVLIQVKSHFVLITLYLFFCFALKLFPLNNCLMSVLWDCVCVCVCVWCVVDRYSA